MVISDAKTIYEKNKNDRDKLKKIKNMILFRACIEKSSANLILFEVYLDIIAIHIEQWLCQFNNLLKTQLILIIFNKNGEPVVPKKVIEQGHGGTIEEVVI
jgi:hypothetical protein